MSRYLILEFGITSNPETWKPDSFYDRVKENADLGMHTLVLLDIKVKEQSIENLAR